VIGQSVRDASPGLTRVGEGDRVMMMMMMTGRVGIPPAFLTIDPDMEWCTGHSDRYADPDGRAYRWWGRHRPSAEFVDDRGPARRRWEYDRTHSDR
jgi:hypothetical protein